MRAGDRSFAYGQLAPARVKQGRLAVHELARVPSKNREPSDHEVTDSVKRLSGQLSNKL